MKILVINIAPFVGETMFITPVFKALREAFPKDGIEALVEQAPHMLVAHNPNLNKVITMEKHGRDGGLAAHLRVIKKLRSAKYDLVINLNTSERASAIAALSGGKQICGLAARSLAFLFKPYVRLGKSHFANAYREVLPSLGIPVSEPTGMEIFADQASEANAERAWESAGLAGSHDVIGIHPSAGWPSKCWTAQGLIGLVDLLHRQGFAVALFGGPHDIGLAERIASCTEVKPRVFTGKLNLLELAAMIKKCAVFVCADSGPMHMAAALRVPTVALFGPTTPDRCGPYMVKHIVLHTEGSCRACHKHACAHNVCMEQITVERAFDAVLALLAI